MQLNNIKGGATDRPSFSHLDNDDSLAAVGYKLTQVNTNLTVLNGFIFYTNIRVIHESNAQMNKGSSNEWKV